ncbi:hypothetical protein Tco_1438827 [Tanacetum coccineum]
MVELEYLFEEVYKATIDQLDWINPEGQQYPHDLRKPLPLIPNSQDRNVIPFDKFINNDLAYLSGGVSSRTYATLVTKTKDADYGHIKWIKDLVLNSIWSLESARDVYSRKRIIAVKQLTIAEWHNYKHLDWITVRRDDDKLCTFKEGIESYQKKINLTKLDMYRSDLKKWTAYTAYSNPKCFIYQNQEKKNSLMRVDELHKFSGTLNDVRSALDDTLKNIRMKYLPQTIWRKLDRERAGAMIQAIDRQLRTRRIMWNLEKFIERFNTVAGNPVKETLLKWNLPDRSILTDLKVHIKVEMEIPDSSSHPTPRVQACYEYPTRALSQPLSPTLLTTFPPSVPREAPPQLAPLLNLLISTCP